MTFVFDETPGMAPEGDQPVAPTGDMPAAPEGEASEEKPEGEATAQ